MTGQMLSTLFILLMKKLFALFTAAVLCTGVASAQEAFRHLGASIELGTTGLGVNISYPVITDRLVVTVGYNFPSLSVKSSFDMNGQPINSRINQANQMIDTYNSMIQKYPEQAAERGMKPIDRIENVNSIDTKVKAKLNFGDFKLLAEYYPTKKSFFHFTAGVFIGNGEWMNVTADVDKAVWQTYTNAVKQNSEIPNMKKGELTAGIPGAPVIPATDIHPVEGLEDAAKVNIHNDTYHLAVNSGGRLNTKLAVQKIKPYIGVGFGSSVPTKKRLGFQMELGAYYQSKPTFESPAIVAYDDKAFSNKTVDDIVDNLVYLRWYPQLTFRFTGRIF